MMKYREILCFWWEMRLFRVIWRGILSLSESTRYESFWNYVFERELIL